MIYFTFIARVVDGLPLAANIQEDDRLSRHIVEYQNQAKQLVCRMTPNSPSRCSLIASPYMFHYLLDRGVCYLVLTEGQFNRTKAFAFLEAIQTQFYADYSSKIHTVSRPYAFLDFDRFIRKTQKTYTDSRSSNLNQLNVALQDVQRIMVQNIDDVLQRGEALSALDARASNLSTMSKKYRQDASALNLQSAWVFYFLFCIVILAVFTYIYLRYDVVVDCTDNLATRYLVNDACAVCGCKPLVSGSALRLEGQMTVYLADRMRTKEEVDSNRPLPQSNRAPCFRCLFPVPPPPTSVQGCSEAGVFGVVPGIIGTMQAAEVLKLLTGVGAVHSGRLLVLDMERNLTRTVVLRDPRPDCAVCGVKSQATPETVRSTDYTEFCGAPDHDKPSSVNLERFHNRITVQQLHSLIQSNEPYLLIDIRPQVEVDLCRLAPCIAFPFQTVLRDSVLAQIQSALDEKLSQSPKRPVPIVLLCHRGNKSRIAATQLASALLSFRLRNSRTQLDSMDTDAVLIPSDLAEEGTDFVVCDVAGGLAAWATEIDPNFPVY
ncbi:unnamed protein product [Dicrocoelium dendriticum]|nr:unnamed protein product [Dicrocoelium dendriticum]